MKKAFTMIELVFVIVILGILAAVAIPKLIATRTDAQVSKRLGQIRAISNEVSSYVFSQGKSETNLSKMSNILKELEAKGVAVIEPANKRAYIKAGDVNDCIEFDIISGTNEENLTVTFNDDQGDDVCKGVKKGINLKNYPIPLRGRLVKY